MKMKLILLAAATLLSLTSCEQLRQQCAITHGTGSVPQAVAFTPHAPVYNGNRYTATWGDPNVVNWVDNSNGYRWTCSYQEFFRYCGGNHPSKLGIAVRGKLPANIANPGTSASTPRIALAAPGEGEGPDESADEPARFAVP